MTEVYSKVNPDLLLHIIVRAEDFTEGRKDLASPNEFLQCALLNMPKGKTFQPHKHIWKTGPRKIIAQESWFVFKGKVKCTLFDIDDTILGEWELKEGELSMTFEGGHTYEMMEDSMVAEYKSGPYMGQQMDKQFIQLEEL